MKKKWLVLQVAATYIGTIVGAGFATGKEIVQFFTIYGHLGTLFIFVSGLLFTWLGTKMMLISSRIGAHSYRELNLFLFGPTLGKVFNVINLIILFGVTSVMLAGAGAVFKEQLSFSSHIGILLTLVLTFIFLMNGITGLLTVNSIVVPFMVTFAFIMGFGVLQQTSLTELLTIHVAGTKQAITAGISALSYVAFNLLTAQAVFAPLGKEIKDETVIKWGGILGGVVFSAALLMLHLVLMASPHTLTYDIPIGMVVQVLSPIISTIFIVIIYGEIFTTYIGNVYGLNRQVSHKFRLGFRVSLLLILFGTFLISQLEYGFLVKVTYPIYGYVSMILLILLAYKNIPNKL